MIPGRPSRSQFSIGSLAGATLAVLAASVLVAGFEVYAHQGVAFDVAPAVGLLLPIGLALSLLLSAWTLAIHGPSRLRLGLLLESAKRRYRLLLLGPFLVFAWVILAYLARWIMTEVSASARTLGLLLSFGSLALIVPGGVLLDRAATVLSRHLARPSLGLAVAIFAVAVLGGGFGLVHLGQTSGSGGPLALFGVLRREELELRPLVSVLALGLAAYAGALWGRRRSFGPKAWVLLAGLMLAAGTGFSMARALSSHTALRFERSPSLSGRLLVVFQGLTDRDRDGLAGQFGGGDCNDADPTVHPGAFDIPGNGIDEDCSGADASLQKSSGTKAAAPTEEGTPASLPDKANVLLLTVDTLRYDLGYTRAPGGRPLSPRLDRLAQSSTVFENAYALASYTSKSLGPAFIGRYPSETARNFDHFDRFSPAVPFVQERLQKSGVVTSSVQGYWYFFSKGYGFERGWDRLDSKAAPRAISVDADGSSNGDKVADQMLVALADLAGSAEPFFLWGHWVDPHAEYVKHEKYDFGRESRDRYDGEVAFVDEQLGRVLDALAQSPQASRTIVIVTSDHGEAFGEHGLIRHGFEVWEELVRVPLLVFVPGVAQRRVEERRSLIDLTATLLHAFAVAAPAPDAPDFVRGHSLLADVLAPAGAALQERPVLVDMPQGPHNRERRAFLSGDYKLITSDGRVLGLYDLKKDPGEKKDLSEDKALLELVRNEQAEFLSTLQPLPARR